MPIVSIIIPCFNQEKYIAECLDSVLNQSYTDLECIVINDGSTDNSLLIVSEYIQKDSRVKVVSQENQGLSNSRNNGIKIAKGEFILPLDADDMIGSTYVEDAIGFFKENTNYSVVYCNARYFGKKEDVMDLKKYSYKQLLKENCIFCSAFFKKSEYNTTKGYDPNLIYGYEDWEFWIQLLNEKSKVHKIEKELFYYRQTENSMISFTKDPFKVNFTMNCIYQKHSETYGDIFFKGKLLNAMDIVNTMIDTPPKHTLFLNIKKTISYKIFVKLECFLRGIKFK
ncbi:glycosyltransferase family 2 protein [Wenyingzhuangia sp. IMCC45467]